MAATWQLPSGLASASVLKPRAGDSAQLSPVQSAAAEAGTSDALVVREAGGLTTVPIKREPVERLGPPEWYWMGDYNQWKLFDKQVQMDVEALYKSQRSRGTLTLAGTAYTVDTRAMTQTNTVTGFVRRLRRERSTAGRGPGPKAKSPRSNTAAESDVAASAAFSSATTRTSGKDEQLELARRQVCVAQERVEAVLQEEQKLIVKLRETQATLKHEEKQLFLAKRILENATQSVKVPSSSAQGSCEQALVMQRSSVADAVSAASPLRSPSNSSDSDSSESSSGSSSEEESDAQQGQTGLMAGSITKRKRDCQPPDGLHVAPPRTAQRKHPPGFLRPLCGQIKRLTPAGLSRRIGSKDIPKAGQNSRMRLGLTGRRTELLDLGHTRKPRRLALHRARGQKGAPSGLYATCALDATIRFGCFSRYDRGNC